MSQAQEVGAVKLLRGSQHSQAVLDALQVRIRCMVHVGWGSTMGCSRGNRAGAAAGAVAAAAGGAHVMGPWPVVMVQPPTSTPLPSGSTCPPAALTAAGRRGCEVRPSGRCA